MNAFAQPPRERLQDRRRSERFGLDQTTTVTLSIAGRDYRCCLEDISYGGLRVRFEDQVPDGDRVVLEHGFVGKLYGTKAWQGDAALGIEFQTTEGALEHALQCVGLLVSPDDEQPRQ